MCRVLQVAPAGYYAWRTRTTPSQRALVDELLMARIRLIFARHHRRYGAPRVHDELRDEGQAVSRKRVARLMRQDGLVAL
jgi:transposase InsO family protein